MRPHIHLTKTKLMKTQSLLLLTLAFLAFSCKKDPPIPEPTEPVMPPLTHQGLNTFGCRVNGKVWVAGVPFSVGGPVKVNTTYHYNSDGLFVVTGTLKNNEDVYDKVIIRGNEIHEVGYYTMYVPNEDRPGFTNWSKDQYNCSGYLHNIDNPGSINITFLDTSARIISGTFEMDLINHPSCESETLKITEGRFDVNY